MDFILRLSASLKAPQEGLGGESNYDADKAIITGVNHNLLNIMK